MVGGSKGLGISAMEPHNLLDRADRRLNLDIAALSETGCSDEEDLIERGAGFTLFWDWKPKELKR